MQVARRIRVDVSGLRRRGLTLIEVLLILAIYVLVISTMFPASDLLKSRGAVLIDHPDYGGVAANVVAHGEEMEDLNEDFVALLRSIWDADEIDGPGLEEILDRYENLRNANLVLQTSVQNCIDVEVSPLTKLPLRGMLTSLQEAEQRTELILLLTPRLVN